nr:unnamed protein product [Callosobruchus analis]
MVALGKLKSHAAHQRKQVHQIGTIHEPILKSLG